MKTSTQIVEATASNVMTARKADIERVNRYLLVSAQIDALEAEKKALKAKIIGESQDGVLVDKGGVKLANWSLVTSNRFDSARFKVENENLYNMYLKPESHTTLWIAKNFASLKH